jgi:predicted permease
MRFGAPSGATDNATFFRNLLVTDVGVHAQYARMEQQIRALPGVLAVGIGSTTPLRATELWQIKIDGRTARVGEAFPQADFRTADVDYFRAAGIPLVKGREFITTDHPGTERAVIVNRTFVDRYFPNDDTIGKRIALTGEVLQFTPLSPAWRTIVGVVGNTQDGGLDAPARPVMFFPFAQELAFSGHFVIRTDRDPVRISSAVRKIVHEIAPSSPIQDLMTVAEVKDQSIAPRRLNAELVSALGILAVIIATVGIAGVLAFSVSARTQEIGIRMSLGADQGRVQRMILGEVGRLLVIGLTLGVIAAFFMAEIMRGFLYDVPPHDPVTFVSVALGMATIGIAACWIPARRASRIDPAITMRTT